jgi:hypothetical protein
MSNPLPHSRSILEVARPSSSPSGLFPRANHIAVGVVIAFFSVLVLPVLFSNSPRTYEWDESEYHLPTIRAIHAHWPTIDLVNDCKSAIAPGLHYLLATVAQLTGTDRVAMRLANFLISAAGLIYLGRKLKALPPVTAGAALACLAGSSFFLKSAAFVYTDNAALIAIAITLAVTLSGAYSYQSIGTSMAASVSIFVRQNSAWLLLPLAWNGLLHFRTHRKWDLSLAKKMSQLLLPTAVLLWLVVSWRGLVPPAWHDEHYVAGFVTLGGALYALSLMGLYAGPFLWAAGWGPRSWRELPKSLWWSAGVTLALVLVVPMNASEVDGRWGGYLWMLADYVLPPRAGFAIFALLAPIGAAALVLLANALSTDRNDRVATLWTVAYIGWLIASLPNRQIFQRYFEPTTLVFLLLWLAHVVPRPTNVHRRGLVLLAIAQFSLSATVLYLS